MATIADRATTLDIDLFAEDSLRAPFDDYRQVRDAGPVVRLGRPDAYAIGRYADVQAALRAPEALISGEGVGFNDVFNMAKGRNVLQSDGDVHKRMRATVMRPLTPATLKGARDDLKAMVATRVGSLAVGGSFDAMRDLASFLPIEAVSHLVGLPDVGRERMLDWAAAAFNVVGPNLPADDVAKTREVLGYLTSLTEETVASGSWAGELFTAARNGKLAPHEALGAISAYVIPSLDTTILAKGHLLHNLASQPEQWAMLRERPDMIPAAVLENLRHSSPLRWFARVAAADYAIDEFVIPQGARVMVMYGCANRDERHYADPDHFDITRDARDHLAWGTGPHMCAGMHLARIEMEVMLEALVEANVTLAAGEPIMGTNAGLYGFTALPFEMAFS